MCRLVAGVLGVSLLIAAPLSFAEGQVISEADKKLIASTILCQNLPAVTAKGDNKETYVEFLENTHSLFSSNASTVKKSVTGIYQDRQISYLLNEPISVVGMSFDSVYITKIKDVGHIYYQLSAIKPFTKEDEGLISNIPLDDKLTVSTKDQQLKVSCNIKTPK